MSAETHAHARVVGAYSAHCLARYPEALAHLEELLRWSEGDHELGLATMGFPGWSQSWHSRSQALCEMGRLEEARAALAKAEEILRAEPRSEVNTWAVGDRVRIAHSAGPVPPFQGEDPRPAVLIEETSARSLLPRLVEERARLAALRGGDRTGAAGHRAGGSVG